ncbi:MAG: TIGR03086 family protein [Acidimicrobiales bacterium]|nr:TIGR03086 family protein [Acidimicrobiales bacterium]
MTDPSPSETFRSVASRFSTVVDGVRSADAWDAPSPVAGWTARDVVGHLVEWFPAFLAAGTGIELSPGPSVVDDPAGAWRVLCEEVQDLLDEPGSVDVMLINEHIGEVPLPQAIDRFFTGDVFMHTWDLARATGQDDTLDPGRCEETYLGMLPMDEMLRSSGQFGPRVDVPEDSDFQTKLIGFIGRDPAWQPDRSA